MEIDKLLEKSLLFLVGFLSCLLIFYGLFYGLEVPLNFVGGNDSSLGATAPSDWISEKQIKIYNDKIIIELEGVSLSRYASTGSMKPILDENANGIRIVPESADQIKAGDIVSVMMGKNLVVHRIIEKGEDDKGFYFITRGDNNLIDDGKIRFKDIKYVTVGLLYWDGRKKETI